MNQSHPSCKAVINRVGPWFYLAPIVVDVPNHLPPDRFARFDYALDFAGCSARGIRLSVKHSAGPARIGPYPMLKDLPPGWVGFHRLVPGLLLRTEQPRLAFISTTEGRSRKGYELIGIHREDLAEIVELAEPPDRAPQAMEVVIREFSPELLKLIVQYSTQLKLVLFEDQLCVRSPSAVQFSREQWKLLDRYIYTGKTSSSLEETCQDESNAGVAIRRRAPITWPPRRGDVMIELHGSTLDQVVARWGISEQKPVAYNGSGLLFQSIHVKESSKLSRLFPTTKLLGNRVLRVPTDSSGLPDYNLHQAAEAGVVPMRGDVLVDGRLERIFLRHGQVLIGDLKSPLEFRRESHWEDAGLLCPMPLVESHLLSAAKAARTFRLPANLTKYRVRTLDESGNEVDLLGTYYLTCDLATLPVRDFRRERSDRKSRFERLRALYGEDLPPNFEKHTDEELKAHFEVNELVARGEFVPANDHSLLPKTYYLREAFLEWIAKVRPDLVVIDPMTKESYLRSLCSIDELAGARGFCQAIGAVLQEPAWLRMLMLNSKARAAIISDKL